MPAQTARILTAVAAAAVGAITIFFGMTLVHANTGQWGALAWRHGESPFGWFLSVPDFASSMPKKFSSAPMLNPQRASDRAQKLNAALTNRPMASAYWAELARAQALAGRPSERVEQTFFMSVLSGPDEGYAMLRRAIIGVAMWENLSLDLHHRIAADLAGTFIPSTEDERNELRSSITLKPGTVREDIRSALLVEHLPANAMARIGL